MELSKNIYTERTSRTARILRFLALRHTTEPFPAQSDHWRPSAQRDVGKSATEATGIQLVIAGLEPYNNEAKQRNHEGLDPLDFETTNSDTGEFPHLRET